VGWTVRTSAVGRQVWKQNGVAVHTLTRKVALQECSPASYERAQQPVAIRLSPVFDASTGEVKQSW
jgi:hypothetical protein